jgi:hypothetical protein
MVCLLAVREIRSWREYYGIQIFQRIIWNIYVCEVKTAVYFGEFVGVKIAITKIRS